jgi:hypothetical protein
MFQFVRKLAEDGLWFITAGCVAAAGGMTGMLVVDWMVWG